MANRLALPTLYVILDAALLPPDPLEFTDRLLHAGVRLFQYRNKNAPARELLQASQALSIDVFQWGAKFIVNDRADIARLSGAAGVHLGQDDLEVDLARQIVGDEAIVGVSTHNRQQFEAAVKTSADYIAVGPVFATVSKRNPGPVAGTQLIREVRGMTSKPIVAIGGITVDNAREVLDAGADSLAVISDILTARNPAERARQFLEILPAAKTAGN
jgi:thiamine-phosphate pyrophosphorylase